MTKFQPIKKYLYIVSLVAIAILIFAWSAAIGGITWDEFIHRNGSLRQFRVALGWLSGEEISFRAIPSDLAFYGIFPTGIVTAVDTIWSTFTGDALTARAFGIWLHGITFILYCLSAVLVFDILRRHSLHWLTAYLGTFFLLLFPVWFGYGLMDYKDMPTAFFLLLLVYCCARAIAETDKGLFVWTVLAVIATIALGATKVAAIAISFVPWLAITITAFRRRLFWLLFFQLLVSYLGWLSSPQRVGLIQ